MKNTHSRKPTVNETRAALAAAIEKRDRLKHTEPLKEDAQRLGAVQRFGAQVQNAEASLRAAKAELEIFDAMTMHQDALLAAEIADGDPVATAAAEWLPTVAAKVQEIADIDAKKKQAIKDYEELAACRPFDALTAKRRAAGEPEPLVPPAFAPRVMYTIACAPQDNPHATFSPESYARTDLQCQVPEAELGRTADERLEAMLDGHGNRIQQRNQRQAAIQRAEASANDARLALFEQNERDKEEAAQRENDRKNKELADRRWSESIAADRRKADEKRDDIRDKQRAADTYVDSLRGGS